MRRGQVSCIDFKGTPVARPITKGTTLPARSSRKIISQAVDVIGLASLHLYHPPPHPQTPHRRAVDHQLNILREHHSFLHKLVVLRHLPPPAYLLLPISRRQRAPLL